MNSNLRHIRISTAMTICFVIFTGFSAFTVCAKGPHPDIKEPKKNITSTETLRGHVDAVYGDHIVIDDHSVPLTSEYSHLKAGEDIEIQVDRNTGKVISVRTISGGLSSSGNKSRAIRKKGTNKWTNY